MIFVPSYRGGPACLLEGISGLAMAKPDPLCWSGELQAVQLLLRVASYPTLHRAAVSKLFSKRARFDEVNMCEGRPFCLTFFEPLK